LELKSTKSDEREQQSSLKLEGKTEMIARNDSTILTAWSILMTTEEIDSPKTWIYTPPTFFTIESIRYRKCSALLGWA
jgi:hypothetical protein